MKLLASDIWTLTRIAGLRSLIFALFDMPTRPTGGLVGSLVRIPLDRDYFIKHVGVEVYYFAASESTSGVLYDHAPSPT